MRPLFALPPGLCFALLTSGCTPRVCTYPDHPPTPDPHAFAAASRVVSRPLRPIVPARSGPGFVTFLALPEAEIERRVEEVRSTLPGTDMVITLDRFGFVDRILVFVLALPQGAVRSARDEEISVLGAFLKANADVLGQPGNLVWNDQAVASQYPGNAIYHSPHTSIALQIAVRPEVERCRPHVEIRSHFTPALPDYLEARPGRERFAPYFGQTFTIPGQTFQYPCDPMPGEARAPPEEGRRRARPSRATSSSRAPSR